jgi:hypothetical protein
MLTTAISGARPPRATRRPWWRSFDPDDPRYPRPKVIAALRSCGRLTWLPASVVVGSAATTLITTAAATGLGATTSATARATALAQIAHGVGLDFFLSVVQRNPALAVGALVVLAALALLINRSSVDLHRERAVLRQREMLRMLERRAAQSMTVESLRADLLALQTQIAAGTSLLRDSPMWQDAVWMLDAALAQEQAGGAGEAQTARVTRLARIGEMLSQGLALKTMWDEMMEHQMALWRRRQRLGSVATGGATIALGGLLPVLMNLAALTH